MRFLTIILVFLFSSLSFTQVEDEREFNRKLREMYSKSNKSIDLIRKQITENQAAPFLANLYMELGDYLTQKANVMYYLKMETLKGDKGDGKEAEKKFEGVVQTTKEAISVYEKILAEFPKFNGRARTYYSLSLALKSIDERAKFMMKVGELIKKHPGTKESVKGRLLLGQYQFDNGVFDDAMKSLIPVSKTKYPYERNLAKYKMGLIELAEGRHKNALSLFEQVALDPELKNDDNEKEISIASKSVKSSLKREALIDSVRAFTEVFKKSPKPVEFYSRISPSEGLFQETIEKLSYRYIHQKKYNYAVSLLRVLSERNSSPEKVLNIYKEVLLMIPLDKRVDIPTQEIAYVIKRYLQFNNFFRLKMKVKKSTYDFFEKQLRDLGTRSHEKGKVVKGQKKKYYLEKGIEFYNLYLATFPKNKHAVKLAMNTGDAFFRLEDYLSCGDFYLRVFKGEFGKTNFKSDAIKNSIYCLQKDKEYSFYEVRRVNGLLIESLSLYKRFDKSKAKDPKTNFSLAKAKYDQGFYSTALGELMGFMKKFPKSKYTEDAANLILDYFNVKSDFKGIVRWSDKILALKIPNSSLNKRVAAIQEQAKLKKLQKSVQSSNAFAGGSTAKGYLNQLGNLDADLRNIALKKALEASKQEKDFQTFMTTARIMASKERDPVKKSEIISSMAQENVKMTNFDQAFKTYLDVVNSRAPREAKQDAFNQAMTIAIAMKDGNKLGILGAQKNLMKNIPREYNSQIEGQVLSILESPVRVSPSIAKLIPSFSNSSQIALGVYKAQSRAPNLRAYSRTLISRVCSSQPQAAVCRWKKLEKADAPSGRFLSGLRRAKPSLGSIEKYAGQFSQLTQAYTNLEGSEDVHIDIVTSIKQAQLYQAFGQYLKKVAQKNPSLKADLLAKANESIQNGNSYYQRCAEIIKQGNVVTPADKYCLGRKSAGIKRLSQWASARSTRGVASASLNRFADIKKNLFANFDAADLTDIATKYYKQGNYAYSSAAATYGLSLGGDKGTLNTLIGCSTKKMNLLSESKYYLSIGSSAGGLKESCI